MEDLLVVRPDALPYGIRQDAEAQQEGNPALGSRTAPMQTAWGRCGSAPPPPRPAPQAQGQHQQRTNALGAVVYSRHQGMMARFEEQPGEQQAIEQQGEAEAPAEPVTRCRAIQVQHPDPSCSPAQAEDPLREVMRP